MKIEKIKIIKSDDRGVIYNCGKSNFISRRKGSLSSHSHEGSEIVYLVKGEIELTIGNETQRVKAPAKYEIPENIHHAMIALTDIEFIIDREV